MLLMQLRQAEFGRGTLPSFLYISADASPQGSLEFYIVLEDKIHCDLAGAIVEATAQEREHWCNSSYIKTTTLPLSILGSGKATGAAKFEALTHAVVLDAMCEGDASSLSRYAANVISFCSDYGPEANLANLPCVCVQDVLSNNVSNSGGLLAFKSDIAKRHLEPVGHDQGIIEEDVIVMEDVVVSDPPPPPEPKCYFGMLSGLMIPGALKHNGYQARRREIEKRLRSAINADNSDEQLPYPPSCPLKNRRSAELASGAFKQFTQEAMTLTREMIFGFRGSLNDSDWQIILADWMSARDSCTKI
eukprot:Skav230270  [mRNA]  locus=scaffold3387:367919:369773:- [translate_table: standard]